MHRRTTLYQIRSNFGHPIRSVTVETFHAYGMSDAKAELTLKPNPSVTEQLRAAFDEPTCPPAYSFLARRRASMASRRFSPMDGQITAVTVSPGTAPTRFQAESPVVRSHRKNI